MPGHPAGPGNLDLERRLGGGQSCDRRRWRSDHPALRRGESYPDAGRHGLQQHPSRVGGDARRARGVAAAGG